MKKFFTLVCLVVTTSIFAQPKVLLFAGSTRAESYNKKLICEAALILEKMGAVVTVCDLKDFPLPFYDADFEKTSGMPESARKFRALIKEQDAIVIASPEYNHSLSGVLKNALDWASRSEEGKSSHIFEGKKVAIMSASTHRKGGATGLIHLRTIVEDIGGEVIPLQVCIPKAQEYFAEESRSENASLREELELLLSLITCGNSL